MNKAYKFRIYPDEVQAALIARTFGCARFVWNLMLQDIKQSYVETKKFVQPTPASYKKKYPFLAKVDSLALCNAQIHLSGALSAFIRDRKSRRKGKAHFPRWKSRHFSRRSYTTNRVGTNIHIEDGKLKLPKLGLVETVFHRCVEGKIKGVTVSQDPSGKYFASILTEQPDLPKTEIDPDNIVGLDFSFHNLFVDHTGARPKHPTWFKKAEDKLARAQRVLSRRTPGSSGYNKQKLKVARIHEHIRNRRLNWLYRLAKRVLDRYDAVVVEDIDLSGMARRCRHRRFGKTISDFGFGIFRDILKAGCEQRGKIYCVADRWFPSSQLCSVCGYQNKGTKDLSVREWDCPQCGTYHDRDQNSGQNLVNWYKTHRANTGASPGIHAEGDATSTADRKTGSKRRRGIRKNCRTVDPTSLCLKAGVE